MVAGLRKRLRGAAMRLARLDQRGFNALPVERRDYWRDAAREAAAAGDDEQDDQIDGK